MLLKNRENKLVEKWAQITDNELLNKVRSANVSRESSDILAKNISLLRTSNIIYTPALLQKELETTKGITKDLKKIHDNREVAIELCLMFASNLSSLVYSDKVDDKRLYSTILQGQLNLGNKSEYKLIISLLSNPEKFRRGAIIEVDRFYSEGKSRTYKFSSRVQKSDLVKYEFKTTEVLRLAKRRFHKQLSEAIENPIGNYLLTEVYPSIELPTDEEIITEAKRIIEVKQMLSKGRKLIFLGNKQESKINKDKVSIVERDLERFHFLTDIGYIIPVPSSNAGGRVADSFNLMPSWIRKLIKIKGKNIVDLDYTCLHPNIADAIYSEDTQHISHDKVAKELGIPKLEVKIEHLSYFNKKIQHLKKSPLHQYYLANKPKLVSNMLDDKQDHYKTTTLRLFQVEVGLMTEVLKELKIKGIACLYVYDAFYCGVDDAEEVEKIMNNTTRIAGINTSVS